MSSEPPLPPAAPPATPAPVPLRCPRCGAHVAPEQDWCLECGAPARTRLAPTPNWRLPIIAFATVMALAGIVLALAFASLTDDDGVVTDETAPAAVEPEATVTAVVPPPSSATPGASSASP